MFNIKEFQFKRLDKSNSVRENHGANGSKDPTQIGNKNHSRQMCFFSGKKETLHENNPVARVKKKNKPSRIPFVKSYCNQS